MYLSESLVRQKPLIVLVGPTAVGKSHVAIALAKALGTDVLTADSRQVYRGMDIGTDKPALEARQGVPHRLIDLVEPDESFNVGMFRRQAVEEIARLYRDGRIPLVVGGTGLYVRVLIRGLCEGPQADPEFRGQLLAQARSQSDDFLHVELAKVDPERARRLHPRDQAKIIRALEVHHVLGRPLSEVHRRHAFGETPFRPLLIAITRERTSLYRRIEERIESQLAAGLTRETEDLLAKGYDRRLGSMKSLGYRQMAGYVAGEYEYEEAVRRLKRDTRHFAKRQLTWFRKESGATWLTIDEHEPWELIMRRVMTCIERFMVDLGSPANEDGSRIAGVAIQAEVA